MEYNNRTLHEQYDADKQRIQAVAADALKAIYDGTIQDNQSIIDALGFEGISPAITNIVANDLLEKAIHTFRDAETDPRLLTIARGYALAAVSAGAATCAVRTANGEVIPGGMQNLEAQLAKYQKLSASARPDEQSLFRAASKVTLAAYGAPLAPAAAVTVSPVVEVPKAKDGKLNKLAAAGRVAAAIAGAGAAVASSAQIAMAATQAETQKPVAAQNDAPAPAPADLSTLTAKAKPQPYVASVSNRASEKTASAGLPTTVETVPPQPDRSSAPAVPSADTVASPTPKSVATPEANPAHEPTAPASQATTPTPESLTKPSTGDVKSTDKQLEIPPSTPQPPLADMQPASPANSHDSSSAPVAAKQSDSAGPLTPVSTYVSERQDDAHPVASAPAPQANEPPVIAIEKQIDLGSLGKAPAPDVAPDVHVATPAANVHVPTVRPQPFETVPTVDLRDIENAHPGSTPHVVDIQKSNTEEAAPDLSQIAPTLKKAEKQEYTPPLPAAPAPAPEAPQQPAAPAPAPAEQAPAAPAALPEAIVDPARASETLWTAAQLEKVKANLPVYLEAQHQTGVPWQVLAAVHARESSLALIDPGNGQGLYQLYSATERFAPGPVSQDEFLRQTVLAAKFIQGKAQGGAVKGPLTLDNPDKVKDVLFSYNGRATAYVRQASDLGYTLGAEGSPYVMNLADDRRDSSKNPNWGQILTDGGSLGKANHEPGAWPLVDGLRKIDTEARAQAADAAKKQPETQVAAAKPEKTNETVNWEVPVKAAVSSPFGGRGEGGVHQGIDYATETGTQLTAAIGGKVTVVVMPDVRTQPFCINALNAIGASVDSIKDPQQKEVRITATINGSTYTVIYAHLSKVSVAPGQIINPGDVIGETGASGCVTGPHLHFQIEKDGVPVNPDTLFGKPVAQGKQT